MATLATDDRCILAVDLGTSGCKTALLSLDGEVLAWEFEEIPLSIQPAGGAEQDPNDWWKGLVVTTRRILERQLGPSERIIAICLSTHGEGTVAVDANGNALAPALLSMDMRGANLIRQKVRGLINLSGYNARKLPRWIRLTGGAPSLSGKDPAGHMLYIRSALPEVYRRCAKLLNVLDYMNLRLTGRVAATHDSILTSWVTDNRVPGAMQYDDTLIEWSGIDADRFPEIVPCTEVLGTLSATAAEELGLPKSTQVVAGAIDTTAAAIGSGAVGNFEPHLYIGTSSWIAAHVPFKKTNIFSSIASVPCAMPDQYLMIALQTTAGGNLSFLKDNVLYHQDELLQESHAPDIYKVLDQIVGRVPAGSRGLIYHPWLHGERCPVDDGHLRAGLTGLSLEHTREDIIRAFYEGVALNTRWMMPAVASFLGRPVSKMRMIGGGALSQVWCQIFADVLGVTIEPTRHPQQANALGAFGIAAVGLKLMSFEQVGRLIPTGPCHEPDESHRAVYDERFATFRKIHKALAPIYRKSNGA